jgi:spore maturation protein CgeB
MHVFVVHPGASFSTHDVYTGVVAGLRAAGATVSTGRIDSVLKWFQAATGHGVALGNFLPDLLERADVVNQGGVDGFNLSAFASAPITRAILYLDPWPDLVLAVSGTAYNTADVTILRRAGIRTALLCTESPYADEWEIAIGQRYDVVFSHERAVIARYRAAGLNAHYLPHAYNPAVHTPDGPAGEPCDVRFIGSLFGERQALFDGVDWQGIDARIGGFQLDVSHAEAIAGIVPNAELAAAYRAARINLNHHRTSTAHGQGRHIAADMAESLGPRAYEIAACGGFQLMDDSRPEARELFGDSLATYRAGDSASLEHETRHWLARPGKRELWAQMQHAAVQGHTWHARAAQLLEVAQP